MSISGDPCKVEVRMACVPRSISILHPQDMLHPAGWAPLITEILQKLAEIDFDFLVASFGPRLAAACGNRVQLKTSADSTLRAPPKTTHSTCLVNTSEAAVAEGHGLPFVGRLLEASQQQAAMAEVVIGRPVVPEGAPPVSGASHG